MMQELGRRYVRVINTLHGRTGALWEGRFKSHLIDSERYLLTWQRYIEFNPVRAGISRHAGDYRWSSHAHYTTGRPDSLVSEHDVFLRTGKDRPERQAAYLALCAESIDQRTLTRIRQAINTGCVFGSEDFAKAMEARFGPRARPPKQGRPAKPRGAGEATSSVSGNLF